MKVNGIRTLALAAAAAALLLAAVAGARQQGETKPAKTPETAPAEAAPAGAVDKTAPAADKTAPAEHKHGQGTAEKATRVEGKYMTIVGEVMDPACFLEAGVKSIGPGHYQCAINCARSGQTLAIYSRDEDRIYFIAGELPGKNPNDPVMAYIHKKVDVTGTVYNRAGAYGIVIVKVAPHEEKPDKKDSEKSSKPGIIDKAGATEKAEVSEAGVTEKAEAPVDKAGAGAPGGK